MEFDYFLKIFELSKGLARKSIAKERVDLVAERRKALKDNNIKEYEEIAIDLTQKEENKTNEMLTMVLGRLNIDQREFSANTLHHSSTQEKVMAIMAVQKKVFGNVEVLGREQCLTVFRA